MNRAERRRRERKGEKIKKEPVLQIKAGALEKTIENRVLVTQRVTKAQAMQEAIHEVNQQLLERDLAYSLDVDTMVLWTLHAHYGWGKKRLEDFYEKLLSEHDRMREFYEIDDLYPERAKLKAECGVDVEELNRKFQEKELAKGNTSHGNNVHTNS